ncbi:hypothetical protein [Gordonia effusa]|nr:hypothetical protein [Gordonia effusa]
MSDSKEIDPMMPSARRETRGAAGGQSQSFISGDQLLGGKQDGAHASRSL